MNDTIKKDGIKTQKELIIVDEELIKDKLYFIRGKQVMIDKDLAEIYGYTTKAFNQQVQRNIERFDEDFRFQLSDKEVKTLSRSQIVTMNNQLRGHNIKYNPYAFTEEGIYMLMTVLKGNLAIKQSKALIRIFKSMKDYIASNNLLKQEYINNMVLVHDNKINELYLKLEPKINNKLFFSGQVYDAYSLLIDIFNSSKEEIIIIDNYADKKILDLVSNINTKVIVVSKNMNQELIDKYQKQYNNLTVIRNDEFHDRFIIIDRSKLYSCGASFKDLDKKCFTLDEIFSQEILNNILLKIM